ncbi:hypothetical protein LINPERPRIM_LOCUS40364 [Linum perenne]
MASIWVPPLLLLLIPPHLSLSFFAKTQN